MGRPCLGYSWLGMLLMSMSASLHAGCTHNDCIRGHNAIWYTGNACTQSTSAATLQIVFFLIGITFRFDLLTASRSFSALRTAASCAHLNQSWVHNYILSFRPTCLCSDCEYTSKVLIINANIAAPHAEMTCNVAKIWVSTCQASPLQIRLGLRLVDTYQILVWLTSSLNVLS